MEAGLTVLWSITDKGWESAPLQSRAACLPFSPCNHGNIEAARGLRGGFWWRRSGSQQQPPGDGLTGLLWIFTLDFSPAPAVAPGPILFLISAAMVMKACSTLVALLALVSRKGMPRLSANSCGRTKG